MLKILASTLNPPSNQTWDHFSRQTLTNDTPLAWLYGQKNDKMTFKKTKWKHTLIKQTYGFVWNYTYCIRYTPESTDSSSFFLLIGHKWWYVKKHQRQHPPHREIMGRPGAACMKFETRGVNHLSCPYTSTCTHTVDTHPMNVVQTCSKLFV